jgi:AcrR family transcriptional regulator
LRILEAAVGEVADAGPAALTVGAVAERAGVSLRTVYNYFPDKDALTDAIVAEARERTARLGRIEPEPDLDEFPEVIRAGWRLAKALGAVGDARARIEAEKQHQQRRRRAAPEPITTALTTAFAEARPDLTDSQIDAMTATFERLVVVGPQHDRRRDADATGDVSAWAFATLANAISEGRGPYDAA